jgi:hypothetical protein
MNLFRESDGSLHITISGHSPEAVYEYSVALLQPRPRNLHEYLISLVREAAENLE